MTIVDQVEQLLIRADEAHKAAPSRTNQTAAREHVRGLLDEARELLLEVDDTDRQLDLAVQIAERQRDLDLEDWEETPEAGFSVPVARAPTTGVNPGRIPPGQHLTAGFPILHVSRMPVFDPATWRFTVTGRVRRRLVLGWDEFRALPNVSSTSDFHCVTGWSRLDNTWSGIPVADLLALADVHPSATHAVIFGHPAYSANLDLDVLRRDDVLLAWAHDGEPLSAEHGGPLRLVVPSRYGWKSVKWAFELRLLDRDVRGYWEERGYHDVADPFLEQRFRDSEVG